MIGFVAVYEVLGAMARTNRSEDVAYTLAQTDLVSDVVAIAKRDPKDYTHSAGATPRELNVRLDGICSILDVGAACPTQDASFVLPERAHSRGCET